MASVFSSVVIDGLEINDSTSFLTAFFNADDQAQATLNLQKLVYGPPAYTGKTWQEVTYTIVISVVPAPGDWHYQDFDQKVYLLKQAFDTRTPDLSTLVVTRYGQPARQVQGTAKSVVVDRLNRKVTVQYVVPDGVWTSVAQNTQTFTITTSGTQSTLSSVGTSDTDPTITLSWTVAKVAVNPQGSFYTYQIPVSVTNNARISVQRFPIDISGYTDAPAIVATAGSGGSVAAGTVTVAGTITRVNPDQSAGETTAGETTVVVGASGSITATITTTPDALSYSVYAGTGTTYFQASIPQPAQVLQSDGQMRVPATVSVTLTSLQTSGRTPPGTNGTGWNHAALVAAGQAKADGSDVRVLVGGVSVPFTLVGANTASARVWLLLDAGVAETDTIYLQWGNRNPPALPTFPVGDNPILDLANSTNTKWTWDAANGFYDYTNTTRPGSWEAVSSVGNGYGWKQDNNVVRRGVLTGYATPCGTVNGDFTDGNMTGWTTTGTWSVDTTNPRFGSLDSYSAVTTGSSTASQTVNTVAGQYYNLSAWVWSDQTNGVLTVKDANGTTLFTWTSSGSSFYENPKTVPLGSSTLIGVPSFLVGTSTVTVELTCGAGNYRLDDVALWPAANVSDKAPLTDPQTDIATTMGLLHSAPGVNNLEVPLNGWELDHPATVTAVTHWGITAMTGSDQNNDNVLRLIAQDSTRPPYIVWGQPALSNGGPVYYATQGSPRTDAINPSREQVQFQINVSVPSDPVNGDGTFIAIEGVSVTVNPQYIVGFSYAATQQFYDLNCTITQSTANDGDQLIVATNLEKGASLLLDCKNKLCWHVDPQGNQTLRLSAITLDSLRPYWMKIHPGQNVLTYTEDVVGAVSLQVQWYDAWA